MARINIGLRQARMIANLPFAERLAFIAEELPILLQSAQGLYAVSEVVSQMPRESMLLKGTPKRKLPRYSSSWTSYGAQKKTFEAHRRVDGLVLRSALEAEKERLLLVEMGVENEY